MVPILRLLSSALGFESFSGIAAVNAHALAHRPAVIPSSLRSRVAMSINRTVTVIRQIRAVPKIRPEAPRALIA